MDLWITGAGPWKIVWTDIAAHTLFHSPDRKPVTHKLHSYYDYYPLPYIMKENEKDSAICFAKVTSCLNLQI